MFIMNENIFLISPNNGLVGIGVSRVGSHTRTLCAVKFWGDCGPGFSTHWNLDKSLIISLKAGIYVMSSENCVLNFTLEHVEQNPVLTPFLFLSF